MSSPKVTAPASGDGPDVVKQGYLKKFKTMRKKFFVLRCESSSGPARLEYYDNEKKFRSGALSKRTIDLKTCFNINRKTDGKHKHAIALYTRDDCFSVVAEDENSLNEWLQELLLQQQVENDGMPVPAFEHVWQVTVKPKGLGSSKGLSGNYRLCLTTTTVNLVKMNCDNEDLEFSLSAIRRCGHSDCFFFMEVGRQSVTGTGEIWMQVEDTVIAQNIHEASLNAMRSISQQEEEMRPRSQSSGTTSEAKPPSSRRQAATLGPSWRTRCESMPAQNRPRMGGGGGGGRPRLGSESEDSVQEEPSPSSLSSLGKPSSMIRPRTQSEGEGNHITRKGISSLHKYGIKTRPRTASEGESHFLSSRTPESPTKNRGRFSMPQWSGSGSLRPNSMHRVTQPISNSPPIPNSPLSESPHSCEDRYVSFPQPMHASDPNLSDDYPVYGTSPSEHLLARFSGSGRSRTPDSPTRTPIREESMEFTDEYMNMAPSAAAKVTSDEDQSYMSMTPMTRGSRGSSSYVPPTQTAPQLAQRSASVSGRIMNTVPQGSEDEGYMMMAPRQASKKRGSTGSREGLRRSNTADGRDVLKSATNANSNAVADEAYTMMQPVPKHQTPSERLISGQAAASNSHHQAFKTSRASFSSPSGGIRSGIPIEPRMKPSEMLVRSMSDSASAQADANPDAYMTMEFQPKAGRARSPDESSARAKAKSKSRNMEMASGLPSLDGISESTGPQTGYINVNLPDNTTKHPPQRQQQDNSEYTFMVPSSRPANTPKKEVEAGRGKSAVESLLRSGGNGGASSKGNSEYMNVEFSKGGGSARVEPPRPVPPIPGRVPASSGEYMNVEPGQSGPRSVPCIPPPVLPQRLGVLPARNHTPASTSPSQSPGLSGARRAVNLKSGMEDLSLGEGASVANNGNAASLGSAISLASIGKSNELSPGPLSRNSSCRSSQTSLADRELNYIDVDIGQPDGSVVAGSAGGGNSAVSTGTGVAGGGGVAPLDRRARSPFTRRAANEEDETAPPTHYATIDFTKSEGLRTATTTRENRPL